MKKTENDIYDELDGVFGGEKLYAEALAHLLDRDTKDYIEFLDDDDVPFNMAADPGVSYGDE